MSKRFNKQKNRKKASVSDRAANFLFCEVIDVLIKKYHSSSEKETMSFEDFCIRLRDLSINKINGKEITQNDRDS